MGFRMRKSIKVGKGIKLNFSAKNVGVSVGGAGVHHSISTSGRTTDSVHLAPGISVIKTHGSASKQSGHSRTSSRDL